MSKSQVLNTSLNNQALSLFLCGDVMTGRGIDQILPRPCNPVLHEPLVRDAREYVKFAEAVNGSIPTPAGFKYIWGDALQELDSLSPDVRIINLETSVTQSDKFQKTKEIHYRMHPDNLPCISAANIDCCVLANNHVLDWGSDGLRETLNTLHNAQLKTAGAGVNASEAQQPAIMEVNNRGRVIVFSFGANSSGIPTEWEAGKNPGINYIHDLSSHTIGKIRDAISEIKQQSDIIVLSLHWGGNWGYYISPEQRKFAHAVIDNAGVDIVYGHSSHHPLGMEVYKDRPIIYGCGDLINDYEGIGGYEQYRDDLALMYFINFDPASRKLLELNMSPMKIKRFQLHHASKKDAQWLCKRLNRESQPFNTQVILTDDNRLSVKC